jgi:hypothetical protein
MIPHGLRDREAWELMSENYLFEAAGVLLTRVPKWSALKAWGVRLTGVRNQGRVSLGACQQNRVQATYPCARMHLFGVEFSDLARLRRGPVSADCTINTSGVDLR